MQQSRRIAEDSAAGNAGTRTAEGDTRRHIMLLLLKDGPLTASELGSTLGLSAAGVRRHLDNMVEDGLAEAVDKRPGATPSGRGRPAKYFRLTDQGRANFGHAYDSLASDALAALREAGGAEAVRKFAKARFEKLLADVAAVGVSDSSGEAGQADPAQIEEVVARLAQTLDEHGYAATVTTAGGGVQICAHHCPVAHVATEHPELCEAEQEVISSLLGKHVQPLASIADGHGICTTNIPITPIGNRSPDPDAVAPAGPRLDS